jgi:hypothetical protein
MFRMLRFSILSSIKFLVLIWNAADGIEGWKKLQNHKENRLGSIRINLPRYKHQNQPLSRNQIRISQCLKSSADLRMQAV